MTKRETNTKSSRGKKIIIAITAVVLLLAVFVATLPTLISGGFLNGMIANTISAAINGTATFDKINLSWFGEQSIENLRIVGEDGTEVIALNAATTSALPALIAWPPDAMDATATGTITIKRDEHGNTLTRLIKPSEEPIRMPMRRANLTYEIDVILHDAVEDRTYRADDTAGAINIDADGDSRLTAKGTLAADGATQPGDFDLVGLSANLFDDDGLLSPIDATLDLNLTGRNLPIPFDPQQRTVQTWTLSAASADLMKLLSLETEMTMQLASADAEPSTLGAQLDFANPISRTGSININPASITGIIAGQNVPTALAQPLVASLGFDAVADFGPTAAIRGEFGGEQTKNIVFGVTSARTNFRAEGTANPDNGEFIGTKLALDQKVRPQLARSLAGLTISAETDLRLQSSRFTIPAMTADGIPWKDIAGELIIRVTQPVGVALPGRTDQFRLDNLALTLDVPALDQTITVDGNVGLDGGALRVAGTVSELFNQDGALEPLAAHPDLKLTLTDIPGDTARALLASESPTINAALDGQIRGTASITRADDQAIQAVAHIETAALTGDISATATPQQINIRSTTAAITLSPAISAAVLGDAPDAIRITNNPVVNVTIQPFAMTRNDQDTWALTEDPLQLTASGTDIQVANAPAMAEPVTVNNADLAITALLASQNNGKPRYTVKGPAKLARAAGSDPGPIADADLNLLMTTPREELVTTGDIKLTTVNATALALALGREPDALSRWTGASGNADLSIESGSEGVRDARLALDFPTLKATLPATLTDQSITIRDGAATVTLSEPQINAMLASSTPGEGRSSAAPEPALLRATSGTTMTLTINNITLPQPTDDAGSINPAALIIDAAARSDRLALVDRNNNPVDLSSIRATAKSDGLNNGLNFAVNTNASGAQDDAAGTIDVQGTLSNLVGEDNAISFADATLKMNGTVVKLPTPLADAFMNMDGYITAMLGATLSAQLAADNFSTDAGSLTAQMQSPNGSADVVVYGRQGTLRIKENHPFVASLELTDPFRQMLIGKLHPLLADLRQTENPLGITVTNARLPVEVGVEQLDADLRINIGAVEFDSGSLIIQLLRLTDNQARQSVPGYIEPIHARITNGIITYQQFTTRIRDIEMRWEGTTNLITRQLNLRTTIPVESLAGAFHELEQLPAGTVIPLLVRGPINSPKPELNIEGLITGNLDAFIKQGLGDLLERELGGKDKDPGEPDDDKKPGLGDLLEGVLGGGKADEKPKTDPDPEPEPDAEPENN